MGMEGNGRAIESIESSSRRLKHETGEKLTFISTNGPHPLVSMNIVEEALDLHFKGKRWHFVLSDSKYFTSKAVDNLFREAENRPNDLL